ncbi:MAG: hypothetical protein R2784_21335 [Saprospiraceae bacterium]
MRRLFLSFIVFIFLLHSERAKAQLVADTTSSFICLDTIEFKNLVSKHLELMTQGYVYDTLDAVELLRIYNTIGSADDSLLISIDYFLCKSFNGLFHQTYSIIVYNLLQVAPVPWFKAYSKRYDIYFRHSFQESDYIHLK